MYKKIGFIGMGNMGQAILAGLISSGTVEAGDIYVNNRSPGKAQKVVEKYGCHLTKTPEELVEQSDVVILGTKPQDLLSMLEPLKNAFTADQVVMSLAAGIGIDTLRKYIFDAAIVRIITNTPILVCRGSIGFHLSKPDIVIEKLVKRLFSPLGFVIALEEGDPLSAMTVASAAGTGFIFEIMQYWQEWVVEHGVSEEEARKIVVETFLGTAQLAERERDQSFENLTTKVASKKGVTAAGLQSLRELELEGILRMSFNKAVIRDRELGKSS